MPQLMQGHAGEEHYGEEQRINQSQLCRLNAAETISLSVDGLAERGKSPGNIEDDQQKCPV